MVKIYTLQKAEGLHILVASRITRFATKNSALASVIVNDKQAKATSILSLMTLGATQGAKLEFCFTKHISENCVNSFLASLE